MPFDMTPTEVTTPAVISDAINLQSDKGATIAARRAAMISAFDYAKSADADGEVINWKELATYLKDLIPTPRKAIAAPTIDDGEWAEYTDRQRKGRGTMFIAGMRALFRFADGEVITVNLRQRANLDQPDWAGATRQAIAFYKAKRARNFTRLVGEPQSFKRSAAEIYADGCAVPEIVTGICRKTGTHVSPTMANAHIADTQSGPRYLSELASIAAEHDGHWDSAWRSVRWMMSNADRRKEKRDADRIEQIAVASNIVNIFGEAA